MKGLFRIRDSTANQVSYYHMLTLLVSLPYDRFYSHLILISLTIHTLIHFDKKRVKPFFTLSNVLLQSIFYLTLLGALYAINKKEAFNEIGRQSTIFLLPLIFCFNTLDLKKYRQNLLTIFAIGCTIAIVYLYFKAFYTIQYYQFPISVLFSTAFINHNFARPIDMHATFLSMQIALSLVFLLSELTKQNAPVTKLFYVFCCCILSAGIIQLSSKSVSIALLLIIVLALPYFLFAGAKRIRFIAISASLLTLVALGVYQLDHFRERYITQLKTDLSEAAEGEMIDPRLARWEAALELAAESPVIGHGSGTEIMLLKDRFFEKKFYRSFLYGLNSHNQFISLLIKFGIIGLILYSATLFWGFKTALARKDLLFFSFMLIITAVSFSENFLDVDKGIFFYGVFFSMFIFSGPVRINKLISTKKMELYTHVED